MVADPLALRRRSTLRGLGGLGVVAMLIVALTGCGSSYLRPTELEEEREAVQRRRENAAARQLARQRASVSEGRIRGRLRLEDTTAPGCHRRVVRPLGPVGGVRAVACGNFKEGSWPLAIDFGYLRCEKRPVGDRVLEGVVFSSPRGIDYAADIPARLMGYRSISTIYIPGRRGRYHSVLADTGYKLCASVSTNGGRDGRQPRNRKIDSLDDQAGEGSKTGGHVRVERLGASVRKTEAELRGKSPPAQSSERAVTK